MKYFFIVLSATFLLNIGAADLTSTQLGCYSNNGNQQICKQLDKESREQLQGKITKAISYAIEWLRNADHASAMLASDILQALKLAGYVHDNGVCSRYIHTQTTILKQGIWDHNNLTAGKFPHMMIGLKASCHGNKKIHKFSKYVKKEMNLFPKGEFNNNFQYSLGVIALYVNKQLIPSKYIDHLLKKLFMKKRKFFDENHMSDTESMALMALYTVVKEVPPPYQLWRHAKRVLKKAESKESLLAKTPTNLITLTLMLQALTLTKTPLYSSTHCSNIVNWILAQQKPDGSFGGIKETAWSIIALTGKSLLDFRDVKCPHTKENLNKENYDKFVRSYTDVLKKYTKKISKAKSEKSEQKLQIHITISDESSGNGRILLTSSKIVVEGIVTALQALEEASSQDSCFSHKTKETSWGPMLLELCKIAQNYETKSYWVYYINNESAKVGASKYEVKDGDKIDFVYKTF